MNEFNIIGTALEDVEIKTSESGTNYAQLLVSVRRSFKNKDGMYEADIIPVTVFNALAEEAKDVVSKGTPLLIKGHISANSYSKDDKIFYATSIIAERLSVVNQLYEG